MPVSTPAYCLQTQAETLLSKFMDLRKFHDLFANQELYFRRVDKFKENDPQEALPNDDLVRGARGLVKGDVRDEQELRNAQGANRQFSESHFISCWHLDEGETLRMWDEYGEVAVSSTYSLLHDALNTFLYDVDMGAVRYGHVHINRYNLIQFLFTKRRHFEKERELRVVLTSRDPVAGMNRHYDAENRVYREPLDDLNALHEWVHDHKRRRIDLARLVTEVRVSPWASDETFDDVATFVRSVRKDCPIVWSELKSPLTPCREEYRAHPHLR
jgi:hypothetical protein